MKFLTQLFTTPSAQVLAQRELEDAQRSFLSAKSAMEYAQRMADYNTDRIRRLSAYLAQGGTDASK